MTLKTFLVEVGVALVRPPKTDEYRRYAVSAESGEEAELIAQQMAQITSIMATESVVTDWTGDPKWQDGYTTGMADAARFEEALEAAARAGRLNILIVDDDKQGDPYIEMSDANPERRNNGCMIYQAGDREAS